MDDKIIWGKVNSDIKVGNTSNTQVEKAIEVVDNNIYFYSNITRSSILSLIKAIKILDNFLWNQSHQYNMKPAPIYLNINSYGGGVFQGLACVDIIKHTKVPVVTIVNGCCASAGTFLSIVGKERFIYKHSFMLIHQLSTFFWGKFEELKDEKKTCDLLMETIKNLYLEYTRIPEKKLNEMLKHDIYFDAETCLKYGIVDGII